MVKIRTCGLFFKNTHFVGETGAFCNDLTFINGGFLKIDGLWSVLL